MLPIDIDNPSKPPFEKGGFLYQFVKGWSFFYAYVTGELKLRFRVYAFGLEEASMPPIDIDIPSKPPFKFASLLFVASARQCKQVRIALA